MAKPALTPLEQDTARVLREIDQRVDYLVRLLAETSSRYERCRSSANDLAAVVYAFAEDPEGVGTDALSAAWQTFMQQDSGNFSSEPEPAAKSA
jgi:hypothetical protein